MISVVIPVRDEAVALPDQLAALSRQRYHGDWELVVVDNRSTDGTAELARAWADRLPVRVVDAPEAAGPGEARNAGVDAAGGDRLAFCDGDDVVADGWLAAIAGGLAGQELVTGPVHCFVGGVSADGVPRQSVGRDPPDLGFLPIAEACNLGVRRSAFDAVGGFTPGLHTGEDIDLSWRVQLAGYRLGFDAAVEVHKRLREGPGDVWRQHYGYGRSVPHLYRTYRAQGMSRRRPVALARAYGWLVLRSPLLRSTEGRRRWLREAGLQIGRLAGSWQARVWYP